MLQITFILISTGFGDDQFFGGGGGGGGYGRCLYVLYLSPSSPLVSMQLPVFPMVILCCDTSISICCFGMIFYVLPIMEYTK